MKHLVYYLDERGFKEEVAKLRDNPSALTIIGVLVTLFSSEVTEFLVQSFKGPFTKYHETATRLLHIYFILADWREWIGAIRIWRFANTLTTFVPLTAQRICDVFEETAKKGRGDGNVRSWVYDLRTSLLDPDTGHLLKNLSQVGAFPESFRWKPVKGLSSAEKTLSSQASDRYGRGAWVISNKGLAFVRSILPFYHTLLHLLYGALSEDDQRDLCRICSELLTEQQPIEAYYVPKSTLVKGIGLGCITPHIPEQSWSHLHHRFCMCRWFSSEEEICHLNVWVLGRRVQAGKQLAQLREPKDENRLKEIILGVIPRYEKITQIIVAWRAILEMKEDS